MQIVDGELVVSPTDLTRFVACRHLTALDHEVALGERPAPPAPGEALEQLFRRGVEHEKAYLERLRAQGRTVVEIAPAAYGDGAAGLRAAEEATVAAMTAGADVVYQAAFFDGAWRGQADFLLRRDDRPGRWSWSYDVADTKLARRLQVAALLQMAAYAERLSVLQGVPPERLAVVTGDGLERPYPFDGCAEHARLLRAGLLAFLRERPPTTARPVQHCGQCRWAAHCRAGWRAADDLTLVAGMRRHHADALRAQGIATVRGLAAAAPDEVSAAVGAAVGERLLAQARLQVAERDTGRGAHALLPPEPDRGLALLPEPSEGDVFFDMEGDPFAGPDGLEYLFGVVDRDRFTPYWALGAAAEKAAFEALVDHLMNAWAKDPGMHVYHYAAYEPARLKALSGRYDTRTGEVDRLLRGGRLVDLYTVVKQGIRVGAESYSLKKLEPYYWGRLREAEGVTDALGSVVAFERWLLDQDDALLEQIRAYNEEDCRSTQALRDWLEGLRAGGGGDAVYPRPGPGDGAPPERVAQDAGETAALRARLEAGLPGEAADRDPAQQATWLLGALLDWHRREALPQWWEYFDRQRRTDAELVADPAALGLLSAPAPAGLLRRSRLWRLTFPPQETKVVPGAGRFVDPRSGAVVRVHDVDAAAGWVEIARAADAPAPDLTAIVPGGPIDSRTLRARLHDLGGWVAEHGIDSPLPPWRAARDLLLRGVPRVGALSPSSGSASAAGSSLGAATGLVHPGEEAGTAVRRLVPSLDGGLLAVQGPPGTGKTRTAAQTVVDLVRAGQKVGVCAYSHAVVGNLLDEVVAEAARRGAAVRVLQKAQDDEACTAPGVEATSQNAVVDARFAAGEVDVLAGSPWLFARPELAGPDGPLLDVLLVDEAGQLSLANTLAVSHAARALVLLGDPQQLTQPVRGTHPAGADASALAHVLDGAATIAPDRGVLLDTSFRMHPDVTRFVSRLSYEGRLTGAVGTQLLRVDAPGALRGAGLCWVPVDHTGNASASGEEAAVVAELVADLLRGGTWTDRHGGVHALTADEVLVVAPYNQHVHRVRAALAAVPGGADVLVGTVDKLQGRQAAVVLYTLATSSTDDAPRGREFVLSRDRFTVALSRARALAVVVASPALLLSPATTPADLLRVDALCTFAARADRVEVTPERDGDPAGRMSAGVAGT